jgi:hypothetical protein
LNATTVSFDDTLGNCQPQAGTTASVAAGFFTSVETLENMGQVFGQNAFAGVLTETEIKSLSLFALIVTVRHLECGGGRC